MPIDPSTVLGPEVLASPEARDALATMQRLTAELLQRQGPIQRRMDYYRGDHPLAYASEEFQRYMGDRFAGFNDNWTAPVVQTTAERLDVLGIRLDSALRPDEDLNRVWRANNAERGSSEVFVVGLAAARAFALVWGDPDDEETPLITWERPDQAIVGYAADSGKPVAGLKLWLDLEAGMEFATLYTRSAVWKFQRVGGHAYMRHEPRPAVLPSGGWQPRQPPGDDVWPIPNPMDTVPLVEFRNQTLLDDAPISDIDGVIAMQDAVNLIWAYLMNALDYASLKQRVVLGADIPRVPILNDQGQQIGERPVDLDQLIKDRILWVPGDGASIAEWSAANLDVFSAVIERAIEHIAAQTRTPPHYLIGKIANLSAEALTAADAGQVSKAGERLTYFTPSVRRVFSLVALAQGNEAKARAAISGRIVWKDIQFRALAQKVDALQKLKDIGFPFEWIAEQYGLEPSEVARVLEMKDKEAEADPVAAIVQQMGQGSLNGPPQLQDPNAPPDPGQPPAPPQPAPQPPPVPAA
ncbi:MAG: phage portal protein [Pseudonocardiaceae bacterium]